MNLSIHSKRCTVIVILKYLNLNIGSTPFHNFNSHVMGHMGPPKLQRPLVGLHVKIHHSYELEVR
jgi:hypothetical protein